MSNLHRAISESKDAVVRNEGNLPILPSVKHIENPTLHNFETKICGKLLLIVQLFFIHLMKWSVQSYILCLSHSQILHRVARDKLLSFLGRFIAH